MKLNLIGKGVYITLSPFSRSTVTTNFKVPYTFAAKWVNKWNHTPPSQCQYFLLTTLQGVMEKIHKILSPKMTAPMLPEDKNHAMHCWKLLLLFVRIWSNHLACTKWHSKLTGHLVQMNKEKMYPTPWIHGIKPHYQQILWSDMILQVHFNHSYLTSPGLQQCRWPIF